MMIGGITFLYPAALAALLALPLLWWLMRLTPPRPRKVVFAPLFLLQGLKQADDTPDKTPWWLLLLRMLIAVAVILGLARPVHDPGRALTPEKDLLVLVVDNGWASASHWPQRKNRLARLLERAGQAGRPVILAPTALAGRSPDLTPADVRSIRGRLEALEPQPVAPQRMKLFSRLARALKSGRNVEIRWFSSPLDYGSAAAFAKALATVGRLIIHRDNPDWRLLSLMPPASNDEKLAMRVVNIGGGSRPLRGAVRAFAADGRYLGDTAFTIPAGAGETRLSPGLPLLVRNRISHVRILGQSHAGATVLLDARHKRKPVGLLLGTPDARQPFTGSLYYVERALKPFTALVQARRIGALLEKNIDLLVLADTGRLNDADRNLLAGWLEKGGMLVRFAGPRMAAGSASLVPVRLRHGGRTLGGALSWDSPQKLGSFDKDGPFAGLEPPEDVRITRQVLAEPGLDLTSRSWVRLADGTPLVTARRMGRGWLVLFHVTANADWSSLPMSGLFVDMLRRLVALAPGVGDKATGGPGAATGPLSKMLPPLRVLDGRGRLGAPPVTTEPLPRPGLSRIRPGPRHPPGFYGTAGNAFALNLHEPDSVLTPLPDFGPAMATEGYDMKEPKEYSWLFLLLAAGLFLADWLLVTALTGSIWRQRALAGLLLAAFLVGDLSPAMALGDGPPASRHEEERALAATRTTSLAFVRTGLDDVDTASRAGLAGLGTLLANRTAFEPGPPMGVNIERDELVFFPFIYWPVSARAPMPTAAALQRVSAYIRSGGTILFDSRDQNRASPGGEGGDMGPNRLMLRRLLAGLDIPPLMPVSTSHVLTRVFYLLREFPGRWPDGALWVEAVPKGNPSNHVSGVLIGSNDYAGAWARDDNGAWLFPVSPGGEAQREQAIRAGINMVLYALTGNYKADQVHVPALLKRLGR